MPEMSNECLDLSTRLTRAGSSITPTGKLTNFNYVQKITMICAGTIVLAWTINPPPLLQPENTLLGRMMRRLAATPPVGPASPIDLPKLNFPTAHGRDHGQHLRSL